MGMNGGMGSFEMGHDKGGRVPDDNIEALLAEHGISDGEEVINNIRVPEENEPLFETHSDVAELAARIAKGDAIRPDDGLN